MDIPAQIMCRDFNGTFFLKMSSNYSLKNKIMENYSDKNQDEKRKLEYLKARKNQNLQILENRIHELEIEKQKRERPHGQQQYN